MSIEDGEAVLAFCFDQTITDIDIEQLEADKSSLDDWELVWAAEGELSVSSSEPVKLGEIAGLVVTLNKGIDLSPGTTLDVDVTYGDGDVHSSQLQIPDGGLVDGEWLIPTGVVSSTPCAADR